MKRAIKIISQEDIDAVLLKVESGTTGVEDANLLRAYIDLLRDSKYTFLDVNCND